MVPRRFPVSISRSPASHAGRFGYAFPGATRIQKASYLDWTTHVDGRQRHVLLHSFCKWWMLHTVSGGSALAFKGRN